MVPVQHTCGAWRLTHPAGVGFSGAMAEFTTAVDAHVAKTGMIVPEEKLPVLRDGFAAPILSELDLEAAGITNVIWATSYSFDFSLVKLPVLDGDGYPVQKRGVTAYPGLYFLGLPWLHNAKSGLIYGVGEDAAYVAKSIATRDPRNAAAETSAANDQTLLRRAARSV